MSKDIRNWFKPKTSAQPKKPAIEVDDDVIPESPDVQIKTKRKKSRKCIFIDDSDDDIFTTKKKKPSPVKNELSPKKNKVKNAKKPALKETSVFDMFSGPIKRTDPLVKKSIKKTETGIHSDEEFEKSLLDIDEVAHDAQALESKEKKITTGIISSLIVAHEEFKENNRSKNDVTLNELSKSQDNDERSQNVYEKDDICDSKVQIVIVAEHHRDHYSDKNGKRDKSHDSKKERERSRDSKRERESSHDSKNRRESLRDSKRERDSLHDSKNERERSHKSKRDKEDNSRESYKEKESDHRKDKRESRHSKKDNHTNNDSTKSQKGLTLDFNEKNKDSKKSPKIEPIIIVESPQKNEIVETDITKLAILTFKVKDRASKRSPKKELIVVEDSPRKWNGMVSQKAENGKIQKVSPREWNGMVSEKEENRKIQKTVTLDFKENDRALRRSPRKRNPITIEESPQKHEKAVKIGMVSQKEKKSPQKVVQNSIVSKNENKRDFSVFLEDSVVDLDESSAETECTPRNKKKKMDKSLNESALTDEERHERKMYSAALYQKYLNRSGPKHLGAKEIPEGTPTCLLNCAFLLTGVLDSFERDEVAAAIAKYGGTVKGSMSKKVTHVLAGDDAGPSKMAKAQEWGIPIIGENDFMQMILDNSNTKSKKKTSETKIKTKETHSKDKDNHSKDKDSHSNEKGIHIKDSKEDLSESKDKEKLNRSKSESHVKKLKTESENPKVVDIKEEKSKSCEVVSLLKEEASKESIKGMAGNSLLWVDKYKPQTIKQIIGQHGDASNVKKLMNWLSKWYVNRKAKLPKPSPWAKGDDGGYYKGVLLSGPPGVGKTTTVSLVCKELGFDAVEFNASDTRNKNLIREQIGELLTTTSLAAYAKGATGKQAVTKKHVLVMDEVDGMAGNEDRGGMQELISLIKSSSVPIICMCNDRNSQKMRSLVNYCYELRFSRPRVEQIKSAMMSICCKEGIKIPPDALTQLIIAANQDVRQTLNLLSMWSVDTDLTDSDRLKEDAKKVKKDIKLGPWEAVRKVFSEEDHKTMSIHDKSDLFFYDYSLAPLFVQENYLQVSPHCPKHEVLERFSLAADSISAGDLVDARIRSQQAWGLLPTQAMYASVIPGHHLSGHVTGQIQFPGWLGKNSRGTKMQRLCQEIHAHTRLSTSGSKSSIFLDYAPHLRDAIVNPLLKDKADGIEKSLEVLESYHLLREDLESLLDLSLWPGQRNPMILIDSKVKAAMTRTYNKSAAALPYAPQSVRRARAHRTDDDALDDGEGDDEEEQGDDSDVESDALIKRKKVKEDKASTSKDKPSTSKGKDKAGSSKERPSSSKSKRK